MLSTKRTKFSSIKYNDDLFIIEARRGAWLSPFSENIKIKVVAIGNESCKVVIDSSSRSALNLLNFGANKGNISDLSDYINNEVYKLQPIVIANSNSSYIDHSTIKIVPPEIKTIK